MGILTSMICSRKIYNHRRDSMGSVKRRPARKQAVSGTSEDGSSKNIETEAKEKDSMKAADTISDGTGGETAGETKRTERRGKQADKNMQDSGAAGDGVERAAREKFTWNRKYLTICLYAILVVLASVLIIKTVIDWDNVAAHIKASLSVLSPFLWGAFIAFLINPLVKLFDHKIFGVIKPLKKHDKPRKMLSLLISYLLVIFIVVIMFVYLLPQIGTSLTEIVNQVPTWLTQINNGLLQFEKEHPDFDYDVINDFFNSITPQLMDFSKNVVTNVVPVIFTTSISVVKGLLNVLIAFIVSVYMVSDKKLLARGFKRVLYSVASERTGDKIMETLRECYHIFSQFVLGKTVDSFIIGWICFFCMTILRLPFTPIVSLIVGITNMIPYFGPFIGAVPGIVLILMVDPVKAIIFTVLIVVIQQFDGLYLGPRILGETVGLRPLWIIFAITIGGSMAGVIGMFLGVPVVAVLAYLLDKLLNKLVRKKNIDISGKID